MGIVDKGKNAAQKAAGKVKKTTGEKTDDKDLQAEGKADETKGSVKNAGENVKDAFKK